MLMKPIVSNAIVALAITAAALATQSAIANDSTAELTTGGLVFTKNAAIVMRAEQLFVSMTKIRVRYVFFNKSDKDVSNTVAFPMPDIKFDDSLDNIAIPTDDPQNILGFSTIATGRAVNSRVEQKVFANGVDQTALLHRLGIPLAPHVQSTHTALDGVPREERANLISLGLVDNTTLSPRWRLKTTYFWQQTFPALHELVIEHRYKPSVGSSVVTMLGNPDPAIEGLASYQQKYCTDADFIDTVTRDRRAAHVTYAPFEEKRIEYILTTGANWAGPIGEFTLVVDKGKPMNLVSFCATGVKKISPTRFELRKTNFLPKSDLSILILEPQTPFR
jgi:Domain of unknown function (DUF4424)